MVRVIETVQQILRGHAPTAIQAYRLQQIKQERDWEDCRKLVDETKRNFATIIERELRNKLAENPIFTELRLDIMTIPDVLIEEHIRTSGHISVRSSNVPMLQELVTLANQEGVEPFISYYNSETPGKKYDAAFEIIIPYKLIERIISV